jgi:hypothetical protein
LGTVEQQKQAYEWNRGHMSLMARVNWSVARPFSEAESTGYVATSSDNAFELAGLREALAKNLPADVSLVIYVADASETAELKNLYGSYLGDRLKFLVVPESYFSDPIWARDSLPFPVHMQSGAIGLVDSIYPQSFEPDQAFADSFGYSMVNTGQEFRGGNMLFDFEGNCFSENVNETAGLNDPDGFFKTYFGCKTITLLDQRGGIGDIDERIKFLDGKKVLTDDQVYAEMLRAKGYEVHMIPSTGNDGETYMNALFVNGTIFVPQMGIARDQAALDAYRALGFNPVGVYTRQMADQGDGNIHCVTMNYPPGTFRPSLRGADFVEFAGR